MAEVKVISPLTSHLSPLTLDRVLLLMLGLVPFELVVFLLGQQTGGGLAGLILAVLVHF